MRLRHPDGQIVHLAYCTNVHPAEDLAGIVAQMDTYAVPMRARLDTDVLGLGLWLSAGVAAQLAADGTARRRLRRELDVRGLEVVTLNGFPYREFHAPVVKRAVYSPDWADPARLRYTLDLARVLVDLLPDDAVRGSISTLPLGWREPWDGPQVARVGRALDALAQGLAGLEALTGRTVRVAFEPEPGCIIENTLQATVHLANVDSRFLGVCVDLAHLACQWEDPVVAVQRLTRAGLPIVKVQVSAALEVPDPAGAREVLRRYAEPRFLHQTRTAGCRNAFDDLDEALDVARMDTAVSGEPWRVHYHVPLHAEAEPPLRSTTPVLRAGLAALTGGPTAVCDHLEVETYTWNVLPLALRPDGPRALAHGMAAELAWARDALLDLGLKP
ncbi:metabolite traffic protein EboE [Dactylosporangium matsuzakiense]|uniref:Xylose isomerase n=1 Tax=Dactylosporangium matsuzakiense TaxID=53360 RepID=A0A9W6NP93_9ACTN|nr:metabolite traffic protein EboE [Dactylosporangium matsuzakiense]UWZ46870.1 metabolite traffic protein EboE [Dactylosporangium matsuzakiense]GLL04244.1 xylose isomerase [Dactylosporangium matsuzakiense]